MQGIISNDEFERAYFTSFEITFKDVIDSHNENNFFSNKTLKLILGELKKVDLCFLYQKHYYKSLINSDEVPKSLKSFYGKKISDMNQYFLSC
tara:strand:- start:3123 stop:3401 length:279 start_codon:yes stop_codon:yes gene_type:complete